MKVYLNGKLVEKEEALISVFDHGLLYGDGVFEGIRAYNGVVFRLHQHLKRLENSARAIDLNIPLTRKELIQAIRKTLRANNLRDAYIRLVVTRGVGDLGLDPRKCPKPTVFIITDRIVLYPETFYRQGLKLITASTRRNIPAALNPAIKSLNYLNNILAKIEANRAGVPEAIMLNNEGFVAECTGDNIFIVKNKNVITPPVSSGALDGITRQAVMELVLQLTGKPVREENLTTYDIYTSDECFLTGTAAEIVPVSEVDGRKIASGKPGPLTNKLIREFKKIVRRDGVRI